MNRNVPYVCSMKMDKEFEKSAIGREMRRFLLGKFRKQNSFKKEVTVKK